MIQEREMDRIGSTCAMLGVVLAVGAAMLGPMNLSAHDTPAVLRAFATSPERMHLHGLGVSLGTLLLLGGFVALQRSLRHGRAADLARLGLAGAVVMTGVHLLGAMMGGSVLPALAESYLLAPTGEAVAALSVGRGFYLFYESLLAPTFLTLAATVLLFGAALLRSSRYPAWLGWAGIAAGAWTAAGAVAFVSAGPLGAADIMLRYLPGFMLCMVWVFAVGVVLWRSGAPTAPEREPARAHPVPASR